MKLQYLAVIFVIIVLPIVIVLSQYVDYQIDAVNLRHTYNTKLIDATYDSIKAYQLNTVNNSISGIPTPKIESIEAAVKTLFNSLSTTYGYTGYNASVMQNFIPAIAFTMYDGYYIYSPFENTLTGVQKEKEGKESYVAPEYIENMEKDGKILYGIKPYVYYSCRYTGKMANKKNIDIIITYSLDNYITIKGTIEGEYIDDQGYLLDGIDKNGQKYIFDGVEYSKSEINKWRTTEEMKEYLNNTEYSYAKINGTKYYLENGSNEDNGSVFYINARGEKEIQASTTINKKVYEEYYYEITKNNSAYNYYRDAYEFTKRVRKDYGLSELNTNMAKDSDGNQIGDFGAFNIFGNGDVDANGYIQDSNSKFNEHRAAVIRYVIEKNLSAAIDGYRKYSTTDTSIEYIMPKISETDWDILENNISIVTFLQGFKIGGRDYNKYCVIANTLTKEYVDENDIYIIGNDDTYHKANEDELTISEPKSKGIWKLNFERKSYKEGGDDDNYQTVYYYPVRKKGAEPYTYIGSYSSVIASTKVNKDYDDMYKYMREKADVSVKTAYYTALARERWNPYYKVDNTEEPQEPEIPDEPQITQKGKIKIVKTDEDDGSPIEEVWFDISKDKEFNNKIDSYKTNRDGIIETQELDYGTYYIMETYVDYEKYEPNPKIYEVKLNREEITLNVKNKKKTKEAQKPSDQGPIPEIFSENRVIMIDVSGSMEGVVKAVLNTIYNNVDYFIEKDIPVYAFGENYMHLNLWYFKAIGPQEYLERIRNETGYTSEIGECWNKVIDSGRNQILLISDLLVKTNVKLKYVEGLTVDVYQIRNYDMYIDVEWKNINAQFAKMLEESGISRNVVKGRKIHAINEKNGSRDEIDF